MRPQKKGELHRILATKTNRIVSAVSLLLQTAMTAFGIWAVKNRYGQAGQEGLWGDASLLFLVFPLICWILTLGFRLACRFLPLEMWRLPVKVRNGMKKSEGTLLKLLTLLLELETAVCFFYIDATLYLGSTPNDAVMLLWVAALLLSVYLPGKRAAGMADGKG